jgi:ribosomal protein S18 acetylase RimI-like enzyme
MADDLDVTLDVSIRSIVEADLDGFREWYGPARDESFRRSFERHSLGEVVYLVALIDGKPVGHLGIDLVRVTGAALLWQFGVYPPLQSRGIGTAMVSEAEHAIAEHGFRTAEIGAETDNPRARALYERLGYVLVTERDGEWILRKDLA